MDECCAPPPLNLSGPNKQDDAYRRVLWAVLHGDANMRSAWVCTRNDVLGNLAVLLAALGVFGTGTGWPDIIVAAIMAALAMQGASLVIRQATAEMRLGKLVTAE